MSPMKAPSLTLGIEEEYQIIDPATRELKSYITEILKGDSLILEEVKPELHQSMVEIGTKVCRTPSEVRSELVRLRGTVMQLAARSGLKIAAAGTHPFSSWIDQEITSLERYLLPHVLCLSTSSPFWMGRNTGLKSYRSVIFRNFPRTGVPPVLNSYGDYATLV